jgi:hypothetical protein
MARVATVVLPSLRHWRAQRHSTQAQLVARIGMRWPGSLTVHRSMPAPPLLAC